LKEVNNTPAPDAGELETLQRTNELYKQQGKGPSEKSVKSRAATSKSTASRSIAPTNHPSKKATHNSSNKEGDKNPPRGKIDSSHKLPMRKKRKNVVEQAEEPRTESEDMELETDQPRDAIQHSPPMEIDET